MKIELTPEQLLDSLTTVFSLLGVRERLKILRYLIIQGPGWTSVGNIAAMTEMTTQLCSHHLNTLSRERFVQRSPQGKFVFYTINPGLLDSVISLIQEFKESRNANDRAVTANDAPKDPANGTDGDRKDGLGDVWREGSSSTGL